ncbi:MAG: sigma-70 family RNA polymerase sigma factor [Bacteroidota bacterium]
MKPTFTTKQVRQRYKHLTDEQLCHLYRTSNEQEIIGELLDRYDRYLISLTLPFLHIIDSVGDFKMDLFILLHRLLKTSKPKVFKYWLGTVAQRKVYDYIKKRRPEIMEVLPEEQASLSEKWDFDIDFEAVLAAVESLKPDQRLYIEMAFFLGYKRREIRDRLGWSGDMPRKVRQNAIRNLRKKLEGLDSDIIQYLWKSENVTNSHANRS